MQGSEDRGNILRKLDDLAKLYDLVTQGGALKVWNKLVYPVWDDLRVSFAQARTGVPAPAFEGGFRGNADFYTLNFINTQADEVVFAIQFPHGWKEGTTVYPHVHFAPYVAGTGTRAVRFVLEYFWANTDAQFPASVGTLNLEKTWSTDQQWYSLSAVNATGISGTGKTISSMLMCRLRRDNSIANNLAGKVTFLEFDIHVQLDTLGTLSELTKP